MYTSIIKANAPWWRIPFRELWEYSDLLIMLVKRDLTAIYKQTLLGPLWYIIQPLVTTFVFTVIFGRLAKVSTDGLPQFIFYMSGNIMWNYFSGCMTQGGGALISNQHLVTKVYFPRMILLLSLVITNLAHFLLNFMMFGGFFIYFRFFTPSVLIPQWQLLLFPLMVLQTGMLGLGVGLWVSALTMKYRDLRFALGFLTQLWMYATPIVWPASLVVSPVSRTILWLNPMSFIVECSRWMFTGQGTFTLQAALLSVGTTVILLVSGTLLFHRLQRTFVDTL